MKSNLNHIERWRIKTGPLASHSGYGNNGAFRIKWYDQRVFVCIVSDSGGWEHVSVHIDGAEHTPSWDDMCVIKETFWDDEETVIQYHPAKSDYVNNHPYTLHLWRHIEQKLAVPPALMVGIPGLTPENFRERKG